METLNFDICHFLNPTLMCWIIYPILIATQKMTPLNWMLLNLACSDGLIAGFGYISISFYILLSQSDDEGVLIIQDAHLGSCCSAI
jgi:hypothetical protein